jgi:protein arginine N-methyltransferase 1
MQDDLIQKELNKWTKNLDQEQSLKKVFEKIRDIPYHVEPQFIDPRENPLRILEADAADGISKNYLLGLMLEKLGIPIKYYSYAFKWDNPTLILPTDLKETGKKMPLMYYCGIKVQLNGKWRLFDASWDLPLEKAGFSMKEKPDDLLGLNSHENAQECVEHIKKKWQELSEADIETLKKYSSQINSWFDLIRSWDKQPGPHDGFSGLMIHQRMIEDRIRTLSYKKAIENTVKGDDVVLDMGCGTGILSFFAAKNGCKKVYAIDKADIIDGAMETARRNHLDKNIQFIKSDIFHFKLDEKIDVLIHEQIGNFLWNEELVSKVAYIRDKFLKPDGKIIPYKIELYLAPSSNKSPVEQAISFWDKNIYGINFSNLKFKAFSEQVQMVTKPFTVNLKNRRSFICSEKLAHTTDLRMENKIPPKIEISFDLAKNTKLTGMLGFFKVYLDEDVCFSTEPASKNTHWGQIFIPCFKERMIERDSVLSFTLHPRIKAKEWKYMFVIK